MDINHIFVTLRLMHHFITAAENVKSGKLDAKSLATSKTQPTITKPSMRAC